MDPVQQLEALLAKGNLSPEMRAKVQGKLAALKPDVQESAHADPMESLFSGEESKPPPGRPITHDLEGKPLNPEDESFLDRLGGKLASFGVAAADESAFGAGQRLAAEAAGLAGEDPRQVMGALDQLRQDNPLESTAGGVIGAIAGGPGALMRGASRLAAKALPGAVGRILTSGALGAAEAAGSGALADVSRGREAQGSEALARSMLGGVGGVLGELVGLGAGKAVKALRTGEAGNKLARLEARNQRPMTSTLRGIRRDPELDALAERAAAEGVTPEVLVARGISPDIAARAEAMDSASRLRMAEENEAYFTSRAGSQLVEPTEYADQLRRLADESDVPFTNRQVWERELGKLEEGGLPRPMSARDIERSISAVDEAAGFDGSKIPDAAKLRLAAAARAGRSGFGEGPTGETLSQLKARHAEEAMRGEGMKSAVGIPAGRQTHGGRAPGPMESVTSRIASSGGTSASADATRRAVGKLFMGEPDKLRQFNMIRDTAEYRELRGMASKGPSPHLVGPTSSGVNVYNSVSLGSPFLRSMAYRADPMARNLAATSLVSDPTRLTIWNTIPRAIRQMAIATTRVRSGGLGSMASAFSRIQSEQSPPTGDEPPTEEAFNIALPMTERSADAAMEMPQ